MTQAGGGIATESERDTHGFSPRIVWKSATVSASIALNVY